MIRRKRKVVMHLLKDRSVAGRVAFAAGGYRRSAQQSNERKIAALKIADVSALKAFMAEKKEGVSRQPQPAKSRLPEPKKDSGSSSTVKPQTNPGGKGLVRSDAGSSGESELLRSWRAPLQSPPVKP